MIVSQVVFNAETGEQYRRDVEMPGVMSEAQVAEAEAKALADAAADKRLQELREELLEHALTGTEPPAALRAEYLRVKTGRGQG